MAGGTAASLAHAPGLLALLTGAVFPVGLSNDNHSHNSNIVLILLLLLLLILLIILLIILIVLIIILVPIPIPIPILIPYTYTYTCIPIPVYLYAYILTPRPLHGAALRLRAPHRQLRDHGPAVLDAPRRGEDAGSPASRRGQDKHYFYGSAINSHNSAIMIPIITVFCGTSEKNPFVLTPFGSR